MSKFKGIIPPLVTPFVKNTKKVNTPVVKEHVEFMIKRGIHGVYVGGSTGEGLLMEASERNKLLEAVVEQVNGRIAVIAHVGAIDTMTAIGLAKAAQKIGADAVAAVEPFYHKYDDEALTGYFCDIANSVKDMKFFIYNNPITTGHNVKPKLACKMAKKIHDLAGIKDSSEQIMQISDYVNYLPEYNFMVGNTGMIIPAFSIGVDAAISGMANCLPELLVDLWKVYLEGDNKKTAAKQHLVNRISNDLKAGPSISVYKYILTLRGFDFEYSLLPQRELTENEKAVIRTKYEEWKEELLLVE